MFSRAVLFFSRMVFIWVGFYEPISVVKASEGSFEINPHKARYAVQKVKDLLEVMEAREKDYVSTFEVFADKFKDPERCDKEALKLIDPTWNKLYQKHLLKNKHENIEMQRKLQDMRNNQHFAQKKSVQQKGIQLRSDDISKRAVTAVAYQNFSDTAQRARNVAAGFSFFIEACDDYLEKTKEGVDISRLQFLLDSFLGSHLFGLKNVVDRYMRNNASIDAHVSFKRDEINLYYTQDQRIPALSEVHYIEDYVRLIEILMKLGLKKSHTDWSFAEKLQLYLEKKLTLDDPSAFLQDGFFYHQGIERDLESKLFIQCIGESMRQGDASTVFKHEKDVVPLTNREKKAARAEFTELFQAHQKRVKDHIQALSVQERQNIQKSKLFLYQSLGENTAFSPVSLSVQETKALEEDLVRSAPKKTKGKRKKSKQHKNKTAAAPQKARKEENPKLFDETTTTTAPMTSPSLSNVPPVQEQVATIPAKTEPLPEVEKTLVAVQAEPALLDAPQKSVKTYQAANSTHSKGVAYPPFKEKEEVRTRTAMNTASAKVLQSLSDSTTSPFSIGYQEALTAMGKIGIKELQSKRKGDFRKLVRVNANDEVIGRVFAYCPATSKLGYELMRIYHDFINDQLNARPELKTLF